MYLQRVRAVRVIMCVNVRSCACRMRMHMWRARARVCVRLRALMYSTVTIQYFRDFQGFMVFVRLDSMDSFEESKLLLEELIKVKGEDIPRVCGRVDSCMARACDTHGHARIPGKSPRVVTRADSGRDLQ